MVGILGNFKGIVKPWWLPFDWVLCRIMDEGSTAKVTIVKNSNVCNVYGMAVEINSGAVARAWRDRAHGTKLAQERTAKKGKSCGIEKF